MVEKQVKTPNREYLTSGAVEKKEVPPEIRYPHTRKCHELIESQNCKTTIEKELTESQSEAYNQMLESDRIKKKRREYRRNRQVSKSSFSK